MEDYSKHFTEKSFWRKVQRYALKAGKAVIQKALELYYAFRDEDTPAWAKAIIASALGYFIFPMDAIPDITPVLGFTDDLGALLAALGMVAAHVKPEHKEKARRKLSQWFGDRERETPQIMNSSEEPESGMR